MDWTEAETRLATLEREVTRRQRLAQENRALARDVGRVAAVAHGPRLARWRRLPLIALLVGAGRRLQGRQTVTQERLAMVTTGERGTVA